jgi:hypothetical protein
MPPFVQIRPYPTFRNIPPSARIGMTRGALQQAATQGMTH